MSEFTNRQRARQLVDFGGMKWGKKMPTDIDALMDFNNEAFVFVEVKHERAPLPFGQKLALMRVVDAITDVPSVLIIARHDTPTSEDIDLGLCRAESFYMDGAWHRDRDYVLVRTLIEELLEGWEIAA